tara:strand:- start:675 stop:1376 length:702 start_codon:yes stop_codon:yes gene_type:complete
MGFDKAPVLLSSMAVPFPDPEDYDDAGLVAIGGELSPNRIINAYKKGIFPWYEEGQPHLWWSPNPRMLIFPESFHLTRSLKKSINRFDRLSIDEAFEEVIRCCASVEGRLHRTWITEEMIHAYTRLHQLGYAHSVEVWHKSELVGGLYGISLGRAFFGESMFHTKTDASKAALYHLARLLMKWQFDFIDCQLPTPHLQSLGGKHIHRSDFLEKLQQTLRYKSIKGLWVMENNC